MQRRKRTDRVRGWRKRSRYSGTVPPVLAVSRTGGGLRRVCRMAGEASASRLLWVRGVRGLDVPCDYKKKAPERRRISVELCGKLSSHAVDGLRGFAIRRAVCHGKKRISWRRSEFAFAVLICIGAIAVLQNINDYHEKSTLECFLGIVFFLLVCLILRYSVGTWEKVEKVYALRGAKTLRILVGFMLP